MKAPTVKCYQTSDGKFLTDVNAWRQREIELILAAPLETTLGKEGETAVVISDVSKCVIDQGKKIIEILRASKGGRPEVKVKKPRTKAAAAAQDTKLLPLAEPPNVTPE